jgi:hypothetical protein
VVFADTIIIPGSDNQIIYNDNGVLAGSSNLTFDGAAVSVGGSTATTGASWSSGTATVIFNNGPTIPVGSVVSIAGVVPSGYNGSWVTTGASSTQVQFAVASNPGLYTTAGTISYGNMNLGGSKIGGIASQELAEAGTNDNTIMTPLKTEQHTLSNDLGWSQTWQNMLVAPNSRVVNNSYQNTTTRPIQFSIRLNTTSSDRAIEVSADNINWVRVGTSYSSFQPFNTAVVPVGHYYRVNGAATIMNWAELR